MLTLSGKIARFQHQLAQALPIGPDVGEGNARQLSSN